MKVLINAVSAKSGGAATYIENLIRSLADADSRHSYIFLVPPQSAKTSHVDSENVEVRETTIGLGAAWKRFLWDQLTIRHLVRKEHVDVIVSSSDFGTLWPPCPQILMLRNALFFCPLYKEHILMRHSWKRRTAHALRKVLVKFSAKFSARVVVASQAMLRDVQKEIHLPEDRVKVNPFGVPSTRFDMRAFKEWEVGNGSKGNVFRMLYVAEYGDYKNFAVLFQAIKILSQRGITDILLVTTTNPWQAPGVQSTTRECDQILARDPGVAPFLKDVGYIPYSGIPALYASSDLVLFPSLSESFGHPLVEAMASERAIIAAETAINREICREAACYFQPFDAEGLAQQIDTLRKDSTLRARLALAGRRRAQRYFNWDDYVTRLTRMIEDVTREVKYARR